MPGACGRFGTFYGDRTALVVPGPGLTSPGAGPVHREADSVTDYTDRRDRTTEDRVEAVARSGTPPTAQEKDDTRRLLNAVLGAAEPFGLTIEDFDAVTDLPSAFLDAVTASTRRIGNGAVSPTSAQRPAE